MHPNDSEILKFINRFTDSGKRKEVIETFTCGCCYWFAYILKKRFDPNHAAYIMYDDIANHFGCRIDGYVYDITGDVSDNYNWKYWEDYVPDDTSETMRIIHDCINF